MTDSGTGDYGPKLVVDNGRLLEGNMPGPPGLKGGDGGGTFSTMPPDFPERVASLEANVKHLTSAVDRIDGSVTRMRDRMDVDFRITWGGIIAATMGLAFLIAKGFKWI